MNKTRRMVGRYGTHGLGRGLGFHMADKHHIPDLTDAWSVAVGEHQSKMEGVQMHLN